MAIRTLLMDIGGVVLFPDSRFWDRLTRNYGVSPDAEQRFYGEDGPWGACKIGQISYEESLRAMANMFNMDFATLTELRADMEWVLNEPMAHWLKTMKGRGHEIIAVSNADTSLENRLQDFGLMEIFDHIVNSARVGLAKPDPAIYAHALTLTQSSPDACLFVDDRARNMPPAESLGIHTVLYMNMSAFLTDVQNLLGWVS